jgi:hypothetical protein
MKPSWKRRAFVDLLVRAPLFLSAVPAGLGACRNAPGGLAPSGSFTAAQRACVKRIAYLMFPYPELGDEPYERAAAGIASLVAGRPDLAGLVAQGVEQLDGGQAGAWIALPEPQQVARLRESEAGPFFKWLYQVAIDRLYNDQRVWSHIGYEGSSFEKGGYLKRGFDDIDWL